VDAYPGRAFAGRVTSISPATGSEYSVLPAQNATGNWVKVVQRLPVRVALQLPDDAPVLRSGMTATARIDTESPGHDADVQQSAEGEGRPRPRE
jgi:membrane fusion protein (multidrug efflux system)